MRKKELKVDCINSKASNYLKTVVLDLKHGKLSVIFVDKPEVKVKETLLMLAVHMKAVLYKSCTLALRDTSNKVAEYVRSPTKLLTTRGQIFTRVYTVGV